MYFEFFSKLLYNKLQMHSVRNRTREANFQRDNPLRLILTRENWKEIHEQIKIYLLKYFAS